MVIHLWFILHFFVTAYCYEGVPSVYEVLANNATIRAARSFILSPGSSLILDCSISSLTNPNVNNETFGWFRQYFNASPSSVRVDKHLTKLRDNGKTIRLNISSISYHDSSRLECRWEAKVAEVFLYIFSMEPKQNASLCLTMNGTSLGLTKSLTTHSVDSVTKTDNCPLYVSSSPSSISAAKTDYSSPSSMQEVCSQGGSTWLTCACHVGSGTIASGAVIIWSGGRLHDHPDWYEIMENNSVDSIKYSYLRLRHIPDIDQTVMGEYECKCNMVPQISKSASVYLFSPPILVDSQPLTIRAKEGSSLIVSCNYVAYPPPRLVQWYKENEPMDTSITNTWSRNVPNTLKTEKNELYVVDNKNEGQFSLHFSQLSNQDRAKYKCVIINENGGNCRNMRLRVKDSMVVIWPLAGILLEALVMLIIIVAYEISQKRRRDTQLHQTLQNNNSSDSPHKVIPDELGRTGMRLASVSRDIPTHQGDNTRKRNPAGGRHSMNSTRL